MVYDFIAARIEKLNGFNRDQMADGEIPASLSDAAYYTAMEVDCENMPAQLSEMMANLVKASARDWAKEHKAHSLKTEDHSTYWRYAVYDHDCCLVESYCIPNEDDYQVQHRSQCAVFTSILATYPTLIVMD